MNLSSGMTNSHASRDSDGQGSLACCSPRGRKELGTTERLNDNTKLSHW